MIPEREGRPRSRSPGPCAWCGATGPFSPSDHVFQRALGGTEELAVPDCTSCRTKINAFEVKAAKRSRFAIKRTATPPRRRNRGGAGRRAEFAVDPDYLFLPYPEAGYPDAVIRDLDSPPEVLPQILVDFDGSRSRAVYRLPEDFLRLADALNTPRNQIRRGSPPEEQLTDRPEFLPRVLLDQRGYLTVRARSAAEEDRALDLVCTERQQASIRARAGAKDAETFSLQDGGVIDVGLRADIRSELRAVTKTALGLAVFQLGRTATEGASDARRFILEPNAPSVARRIRDGEELREWPNHHVAVIDVRNGRFRGFLCFYGHVFHVDLGMAPTEIPPGLVCGAASARDGSATFMLGQSQAREVYATIAGAIMSNDPPRDTPSGGTSISE